jgi:5-formyltetrahydrofolate cyclo-ligase
MDSQASFVKKLLTYHRAVGFLPLKNEPSPTLFPIAPTAIVPTNTSIDSLKIAEELASRFLSDRICLYIPGSAFDKYGTRHGRGGGWYDRFLASVPSPWMRIGLCFEENFSSDDVLKREAWDQPVDWVCVQKVEGMDYYETKARNI